MSLSDLQCRRHTVFCSDFTVSIWYEMGKRFKIAKCHMWDIMTLEGYIRSIWFHGLQCLFSAHGGKIWDGSLIFALWSPAVRCCLWLRDLISPPPEQRAVSVTERPGARAHGGHPLKKKGSGKLCSEEGLDTFPSGVIQAHGKALAEICLDLSPGLWSRVKDEWSTKSPCRVNLNHFAFSAFSCLPSADDTLFWELDSAHAF